MTEPEWLECTDQQTMHDFLRYKGSDRKLRLFACACCRNIWHLLPERSRRAVEVAERFADGVATEEELELSKAFLGFPNPAAYAAFKVGAGWPPFAATQAPTWVAGVAVLAVEGTIEQAAERLWQSEAFRDIMGNPFRPVTLNTTWLTWNDGTVRKIAQAIYDECAFHRMPILGDALTDASCDNADIMSHCRSDGPHVRGCWVVDLLLDKE